MPKQQHFGRRRAVHRGSPPGEAAVLAPFQRHAHDLEDACLRFAVIVEGREWLVEVPIARVQLIFDQAGRSLGCRMPRQLGARRHRTVGGFFDSIKSAYKSATRVVKHALPKVAQQAIHHVEKTAEKGAKMAWDAHMLAKDVVLSDAFSAGLVAASFAVPALAPAAAAVNAARILVRQVETGKKAAEMVARGIQQTPQIVAAIRKGDLAKLNAQKLVTQARKGSGVAQQMMGALRQLR
jgi:hypothetical protein